MVRRNVFETNSSSTHAIALKYFKGIEDKVYSLRFIEAHRGNAVLLDTVEDKLNYYFTLACRLDSDYDCDYKPTNSKARDLLFNTLNKLGVRYEVYYGEECYVSAEIEFKLLIEHIKSIVFSDSILIIGSDEWSYVVKDGVMCEIDCVYNEATDDYEYEDHNAKDVSELARAYSDFVLPEDTWDMDKFTEYITISQYDDGGKDGEVDR